MKRHHVMALFVFIGLTAFLQIRGSGSAGSTYVTSPFGARAFFMLLQNMDVDVEPWLYPYDHLPSDEQNSTMIVIAPATSGQEDKLVQWVEQGNHLVFLGGISSVSLPLLQKVGLYAANKKLSLFETAELLEQSDMPLKCPEHEVCRDVSRISIPLSSYSGLLETFEKVDGGTDKSRVLHRTLGKGDIWLISGEEPVLNRNIDLLDNLRFMYQLATTGDRVLFDEFHHGYTAPANIAMQSKHAAVVLLMCFLGFALVIGALSRSVRFGPPVEEVPQNSAGLVEFASVLGLLCEEHHASSVLGHYLDAWKMRVESLFGISRKLPPLQMVHELIRRGHVPGGDEAELCAAVDTLLHSATVPAKHAERAVATLEQYS